MDSAQSPVPQYPLTEQRREAVLEALAGLCGQRPAIVEERHVGHSWAPVTRVLLDAQYDGVGRSVIVKTRRVDGEGFGGPAHLRREIVGLRVARTTGIAAQVLHVDDVIGFVIQSDLGSWPTLESVLLGNDATRATEATVGFARAVGRLHSATVGRHDDYRAALAGFGSADVSTGGRVGSQGIWRWDEVERACDDLGLPEPGPGLDDDIGRLRADLHDPRRHGGLVHHDLNPTNALVTDDGIRLVDFEGCSFGHIGMDASFLHYPFPTYSAHWAVLPPSVVESAEIAYQEELGTARDALVHYDEMLAVGAATLLVTRTLRLPLLASPGQSAHDRWRRRAQLVQQIEVFRRLADRAGVLPAMSRWFGCLAEAMVERWSAAGSPPPLFPAFTNSGPSPRSPSPPRTARGLGAQPRP
jgi:hypothetical protein